jgi:hypothetical protein
MNISLDSLYLCINKCFSIAKLHSSELHQGYQQPGEKRIPGGPGGLQQIKRCLRYPLLEIEAH